MEKLDNIDEDLLGQVIFLQEKSKSQGLNFMSQVESLRHTKNVNYWDYIKLDTLLSLQQPRTIIPDEMIFVTYHQISELFFKLILSEMEQIIYSKIDAKTFIDKIERINRYYEQLVNSFDIMVDGMNHHQFMTFRKALAPASGFQSIQYRLIELHATPIFNLVNSDYRDAITIFDNVAFLYEKTYWKQGAIEIDTGKKDLSLVDFEQKYDKILLNKAIELESDTVWSIFCKFEFSGNQIDDCVEAMKKFDVLANIKWKLVHLKAAMRHLNQGNQHAKSTGGTNWRKYLPPRYQRVIFFPELWNKEEIELWGKNYTYELINATE